MTALALAAAVITTGCGSGGAASGRLKVVAGENMWGDIASQIGRGRADVTSIISDAGSDPHLYDATAKDAAAVTSAGVVITNGLGYDDFMDRLVGTSSNSRRHVVTVAAGRSGENPHLWYDLPAVPEAAARIERAMAEADPAGAADYEANLRRFDASLAPVLDTVTRIRSTHASAPVAQTERVAEYLLTACGLGLRAPVGFLQAAEDGQEPSPADTAAMIELLSGHQVALLVYNMQAETAATRRARESAVAAGVPVVGVTETLPNGKTFQEWQAGQLDEVLRALGG